MSYLSQRPKTPAVADQILALLALKPHQSAVDLATRTGHSYWHCRNVAADLVKQGKVTKVLVGKSPHYSLNPVDTADMSTEEKEGN
jgi:hypothetical protein